MQHAFDSSPVHLSHLPWALTSVVVTVFAHHGAQGLLKMGDMANVFMECISKEILGVSSGEAYLEAMMRKKEFWAGPS